MLKLFITFIIGYAVGCVAMKIPQAGYEERKVACKKDDKITHKNKSVTEMTHKELDDLLERII